LSECGIPIIKEEDFLKVDDPVIGFILQEIRNSLLAIKSIGEDVKKITAVLK
jgi:hypothetical protein